MSSYEYNDKCPSKNRKERDDKYPIPISVIKVTLPLDIANYAKSYQPTENSKGPIAFPE
jgi:hypothetical protein